MKTPEERAVDLLNELDTIARDVCHYDYGLPTHHDEAMPQMAALVASAIREAVEADRKSQMTHGEEDAPGIDAAVFEAIVAEACAPGATPEHRAGKLLAAWRGWFGTGGPGLFNRLQMAEDMQRVIEAVVAQERERAAGVADDCYAMLCGHANHDYGENAEQLALDIAKAIREGKP